jgi:hypothetical protein
MDLILNRGIFKSFIAHKPSILTPHFEQLASINIFWGLFSFEHQYHPISLQLKCITFHVFFSSSSEPVI